MSLSVGGYNNLSSLNGFFRENAKEKNVKGTESIKAKESVKSSEKSSLEKTVIEMAKQDAAKGVYMGDEFIALRRSCIAQVSPDRSAAIAQVTSMIGNRKGKGNNLDYWIAMLLHLPYKAEGVSGPFGRDTAQIYDMNGEMIASFHWESGWTSVPTSAENAKSDDLKFVYYSAYHDARQAMRADGTLNDRLSPESLIDMRV